MRDKAQMVAYQGALVEPAGEPPVNTLGNHTAHMIAYEPTGPLARCEKATVGRISRFRVSISEHCPGILLTWPARGWLIGDRGSCHVACSLCCNDCVAQRAEPSADADAFGTHHDG